MSLFHRARHRRELFAGLVRTHGAMLTSLAHRLVGPDEAEDVVQTALTSAWKRFTDPETIQNPGGWLMRFVAHESSNLVGRRNRRPSTVPLGDDGDRGSSEDVVSILQKELAHATHRDPRVLLDYLDEGLSGALRALNPDERTTLTLRSVAELSYKEISDVMGVPIGTVMSRLCRAREKVRVELGRRLDPRAPAESTGRSSGDATNASPSDGETP